MIQNMLQQFNAKYHGGLALHDTRNNYNYKITKKKNKHLAR